jgi:LDH2 family malate/lactate/ureidoglycolate dehydrogenase
MTADPIDPPAPGTVWASVAHATAFAERLLIAHGLPEADAATVAHCLVLADLRGVDTHGIQYLPHYLGRVDKGLINPRPELRIEQSTPVAAGIDGQNGFGFVVGMKAIEAAIGMAQTFGVGIVAARRSTHFGMAASYVLRAVEAGFVAQVYSNASPAMPPWGGREPMLGTSPFACGAPGGELDPYVLDLSFAVAARGKIRKAARRGDPIPLGYALDAQGRPTTDATAALDGVVLPIGGYKGSGLAMLMDLMGGVIAGAGHAGGVGNQFSDYDRPQDVGHFFLVMKPDLFVPLAEYRARMDRLVRAVRGAPRAEGFDEILMPGEREARIERARRVSGVPVGPVELKSLNAAAGKAGVAPIEVSPRPHG